MLTLEVIDKTIQYSILKEVISRGFNLDKTTYTNISSFNTDLTALKATLLLLNTNYQIIEVFGNGGFVDRYTKTSAKIVISQLSGTTAYTALPRNFTTPVSSTQYNSYTDAALENLNYSIFIVATTTTMERAMRAIIRKVLCNKIVTIPTLNLDTMVFDGEPIDIEYSRVNNITNEDFIEYVYNYTAKDLLLTEPILTTTIPIVQITANIVVNQTASNSQIIIP